VQKGMKTPSGRRLQIEVWRYVLLQMSGSVLLVRSFTLHFARIVSWIIALKDDFQSSERMIEIQDVADFVT